MSGHGNSAVGLLTTRAMRRMLVLSSFVAVLGVVACSQFTVRSRQDPSQDWAALRTFAMLPTSEAAPSDQVTQDRAVDRRVQADVERELIARGYTLAPDVGSADLLVNWRVTTRPASDMRADPGVARWGTGWWAGWDGGAAVYSDDFDTGALFIALMDARRRQVVWIGMAEARLLPHISIERRLGRVDDAVSAVLKKLPAR